MSGSLVFIFGPNLNDQSQGQFHVHSATCSDSKHYGFGRKHGGDSYGLGFEPAMTGMFVERPIHVDTLEDVVRYVYDNGIMGENPDTPWEDYLSDFHILPCVKGLK